jgi:hypothetical protein
MTTFNSSYPQELCQREPNPSKRLSINVQGGFTVPKGEMIDPDEGAKMDDDCLRPSKHASPVDILSFARPSFIAMAMSSSYSSLSLKPSN